MLSFRIVTPDCVVYESEVDQVTVPTTTGEITILPHHIPLVSILQPGELRLLKQGQTQVIAVAGGFLEVKPESEVTVLADNAERAEEIDIARAERARERAEQQMKEAKQREDVDFAKLQTVIEREANRVRVGNKYRKIRGSTQ